MHLIAPQGARAMVINVMATLQSTLRSDPIFTRELEIWLSVEIEEITFTRGDLHGS